MMHWPLTSPLYCQESVYLSETSEGQLTWKQVHSTVGLCREFFGHPGCCSRFPLGQFSGHNPPICALPQRQSDTSGSSQCVHYHWPPKAQHLCCACIPEKGNANVKADCAHLKKVIYFSDGAASQYETVRISVTCVTMKSWMAFLWPHMVNHLVMELEALLKEKQQR